MGITEYFIKKGLPTSGLTNLEEFSEMWLQETNTKLKEEILPHIIKEKLNIYEEEY